MKKDFIQLPKIIEAYFIAAENYDQTGLANCFAEDIELIDEGEKYSGPSAVSHHIVEASQSVNVTLRKFR